MRPGITAPMWARPPAADSHVGDLLTDRLRGLGPVQLLGVIDLAERMVAAALRDDFEGRERVREEFGIGG